MNINILGSDEIQVEPSFTKLCDQLFHNLKDSHLYNASI